MTQVAGVEKSGLDREAMLMVTKLIASHTENQVIQSYGPSLLETIQEGLGGDAGTLAIKYAVDSVRDAQPWQAAWDPSQQAYYFYNSVTEQTQWDTPQEYSNMQESIISLDQEIVIDGMEDMQIVSTSIQAMTDHGASNVEILKSVIRILARMVLDQDLLTRLSEAPGAIDLIMSLIAANNINPQDHYEMVDPCLILIEKLAANTCFKNMAASNENGAGSVIAIINQCILANMHQEPLVQKCISILVKLAVKKSGQHGRNC